MDARDRDLIDKQLNKVTEVESIVAVWASGNMTSADAMAQIQGICFPRNKPVHKK